MLRGWEEVGVAWEPARDVSLGPAGSAEGQTRAGDRAPCRDGETKKTTEAGGPGMRAWGQEDGGEETGERDGPDGTEPCGQGKVLDFFFPSQLGNLSLSKGVAGTYLHF